MQMQHHNPRVASFLRWVAILEVFILLAASLSLFVFPIFAIERWVWSITPFNSMFLGAVYLAAVVPVGMLAKVPRWSPARLVLPLQLMFTVLLLVVSLLYGDRFNFQRQLVWGWFFLYSFLPIVCGFYLWRGRTFLTVTPTSLPARWRAFLILEGMLLSLYGAGLLLFPTAFASFWPWPIDDFHGRLYSAVFFTPGLGAFLLSRLGGRVELATLGGMQVVLGIVPVVSVAIADLFLQRLNWLLPGSWLWVGLFLAIGIAGLGCMRRSRQPNSLGTGIRE